MPKISRRDSALGHKAWLRDDEDCPFPFDNPQDKYPSLLVAGTNGKGSVCAMLAQILAAHGYRVGLYTSPHLVRVEERIRIGQTLISTQDFCHLLTVLRKQIEDLLKKKEIASCPTYFEVLTMLAFLFFEKENVDMAVLEVGMGGRFDATNVASPLVSVITEISKDHQEFLGSQLSQIAFEKAGIIKPAVPVVCGVRGGVAQRVIRKRAREIGAPYHGVFGRKTHFLARKREGNFSFFYEMDGTRYSFSPSLKGEHQGRNAAVAIASAAVLSKTWRKLEKQKIIEGIENTQWEGRLEIVSSHPLIILDGAHNEGGAKVLRSYIQNFVPAPLILVFAIMRDKEIGKIINILFPLASKIIISHFPSQRASSPEEIEAKARKFQERIILEPDLKKAIQMALAASRSSQGSVLITGSLFLIGEVKKLLAQKSI